MARGILLSALRGNTDLLSPMKRKNYALRKRAYYMCVVHREERGRSDAGALPLIA